MHGSSSTALPFTGGRGCARAAGAGGVEGGGAAPPDARRVCARGGRAGRSAAAAVGRGRGVARGPAAPPDEGRLCARSHEFATGWGGARGSGTGGVEGGCSAPQGAQCRRARPWAFPLRSAVPASTGATVVVTRYTSLMNAPASSREITFTQRDRVRETENVRGLESGRRRERASVSREIRAAARVACARRVRAEGLGPLSQTSHLTSRFQKTSPTALL